MCVCVCGGGGLARHSTINEMGPPHRSDIRGIRDNAASRPVLALACGSYSAAAGRSDGYKQGSAFFIMTPFRHNVFSRDVLVMDVGAPTQILVRPLGGFEQSAVAN